jgi:hypothetical protein
MEIIRNWFKAFYDKILAIAILLILLSSLIFLSMDAQVKKEENRRFDEDQQRLKPVHPNAAPPNLVMYEQALTNRQTPFQFSIWSNRLVAPELRVYCVKCERPIPHDALVCPFPSCRADQPPLENEEDWDQDGMTNSWEVLYKLNPRDPSDAKGDADNDGFSNLEEFRFGTDPTDPKNHPPPEAKLRVKAIIPMPFALVFKGVSKMPNGDLVYQLNLRANEKTYYKKMNEEAEGFKLVAYAPEFKDPKTNRLVPMLTVRRGDKIIELFRDQKQPWNEFQARMHFIVENRDFDVKKDDVFTLRGSKYRVKGIDSSTASVLIEDIATGKETNIEKEGKDEQETKEVKDEKDTADKKKTPGSATR